MCGPAGTYGYDMESLALMFFMLGCFIPHRPVRITVVSLGMISSICSYILHGIGFFKYHGSAWRSVHKVHATTIILLTMLICVLTVLAIIRCVYSCRNCRIFGCRGCCHDTYVAQTGKKFYSLGNALLLENHPTDPSQVLINGQPMPRNTTIYKDHEPIQTAALKTRIIRTATK